MTGFWKGLLVGVASALIPSAVLALLLTWPNRPPPLVEEYIARTTWPGGDDAKAKIGPILRATFPTGSNAASLQKELLRENFSVDNVNQKAVSRFGDFVCDKEFQVWWKTDSNGKLITVDGTFSSACL
jgi:hypothetical protein